MSLPFAYYMGEILEYQLRPDIEDYRSELVERMSSAWATAKENIQRVQDTQKLQYDCYARKTEIRVGDRVMVYMPSEV